MKKLVKRIAATFFTMVIVVSTIGNHTIRAYAAEESLVEEMEAMAAQQEAERIAAEQAAAQAEQERLAAEQAEQERIAAEQAAAQAEQERLVAEQAEQQRIAQEQAAAQAEQERIAAEQAEQQRIAQEQAAAQAEQERLAAEQAKADAEKAAGAASTQETDKAADAASTEEKEEEPKAAFVTIVYRASQGGRVNREKEEVRTDAPQISGATATADGGYVFAFWADENGTEVSRMSAFVPVFNGRDCVYTAVFEKEQAADDDKDTATEKKDGEDKKEETVKEEKAADKADETDEEKKEEEKKDDKKEEDKEEEDKEKEEKEEKEDKEDDEKEEEEEKEPEVIETEVTVTISYVASDGGKVSVEQEILTFKETRTIDKEGTETVEREAVDVQLTGSRATADKDFEFSGWTLNGETVSEDETFVPAVPEEDITYRAQFLDKEEEYPAQSWTGETGEVRVSASAGEGVFPEGTTMSVMPVSRQALISAAQGMAGEDTEVVDAVGADITFHDKEGEEIQPRGAVNVDLSAKRAIEGESHETVTMAGGGATSMGGADATGGSVVTDHFTVYGIIGEKYQDHKVLEEARHTFVFYDLSGIVIDTQIVHDGDALEAPAVLPGGSGKTKVTGWTVTETTPGFEGPASVSVPTKTYAIPRPGENAGEAEIAAYIDRTFRVDPAVESSYEVIFYADYDGVGADGSPVLTTRTLKENETLKPESVQNDLPHPDGTSTFTGWYYNGGGPATEVKFDDAKDGVVKLVSKYDENVTVYFDARGGSVNPPFVQVGKGSVIAENKRPEDPKKNGYKFNGWYQNYDPATDTCSNPFGWNDSVQKSMTLYADWNSTDLHYKVIIRMEHADDDEYDFTVSERTATEGGKLKLNDIASGAGNGFHLNGTGSKDAQNATAVTVTGGAGAVSYDAGSLDQEIDIVDGMEIEVTYRRDTYQLVFNYHSSISDDGYTLKPDVKKVVKDNMQFGGNTPKDAWGGGLKDGEATNEFTVKYGQNMYLLLAKNYNKDSGSYDKDKNANWAIRRVADFKDGAWSFWAEWLEDKTSQGGASEMKFTYQTVFNSGNHQLTFNNRNLKDGETANCIIRNDIPLQTFSYENCYTDDNGNEIPLDTEFINSAQYRKDHTIRFTEGEIRKFGDEYYILETVTNYAGESGKEKTYYTNEGKTGTWSRDEEKKLVDGTENTYQYYFKRSGIVERNGKKYPDGDSTPETMKVYWKPAAFTVTFEPNNGKEAISGTVNDAEQIRYKTDISGIEPEEYESGKTEWSDKNGVRYVFAGWFDNEELKGKAHNFTGNEMPLQNLKYYAKWVPADLTVTYYPENGGNEWSHDVDYEGKAPAYGAPTATETVQGKQFRYWAVGSVKGKPFSFNTPITENTDLFAVWEEQEVYRVRYETDERGTLPAGLSGNADPGTYKPGGNATVYGAAIPADGYIFTGWMIGGTGEPVKGSFAVNKDNDKKDEEEDRWITLVAQYQETVPHVTTVRYHSNYPEGPADVTVDHVEKLLASDEKAPVANGNYVINHSAETLGFVPAGSYNFVCWTNSAGEKIYSGSHPYYFYKGETVAAGQNASTNDLWAVWEKVPEDPKPENPVSEPEPEPTPDPEPEPESTPEPTPEPEPEPTPEPEPEPQGETTPAPALADIPAQDPEDLPAPEDVVPGNLPDANAPGVLGMARRTSTLDTMTGAQVRNYENPDVLGSRRGKTGEASDASRVMTIMGASIILAALARDKKRKENKEEA